MAEIKPLNEYRKKVSPLESFATNAKNSFQNVIGNTLTTIGELTKDADYNYNPADVVLNPLKPLGQILKNTGGSEWLRDKGLEISEDAQKNMANVSPNPNWENKGVLDLLTNSDWWSDPRGAAAYFGSGLGSSVPFILAGLGTARFAPQALPGLATRVAAPLITRGGMAQKLGSGLLRAANTKAGDVLGTTLTSTAPYALTQAPFEAITNAGELYAPLKERGFSDEEIATLMRKNIAEEIPINFAEGLLEGNVLLGKGFGLLGKNWRQRLAGGAGNIGLEMLGEYAQEGSQTANTNKFLGKPYTPVSDYFGNLISTGTPFAYPEEQNAAVEGAIGSLLPSAGGAAYHTAFGKGNPEYTGDTKELRDWTNNIGTMSDETFGKIVREAQRQDVPAQLALAVATAESNGNQNEISPVGAIGVMQLTPETAEGLGVDPHDEDENIHGGIKYLKQMLDKYNGDWQLATAAYNAGPAAVTDHVPQNGETEQYVDRISSFLENAPNFNGNINSEDDDSEIEITPEMIEKANGKYWIEQGGVSYEGAQPQTMQALYALSKWFYEKTGKPLVVTAVTNGNHPSNGSAHGHDAGWKIDIHDGGSKGEKKLPHKIKKFAPRDKFLTYNLKFLLPLW